MVLPYEIITQSPQETAAIGRQLADYLTVNKGKDSQIICLYGDLGSGKTTFIQGLAKGLGIKIRLLSPTFIIVRRYSLPKFYQFFYHIDLYRLSSKDGLSGLGISEIFSTNDSIIAVEWAEKLDDLLPQNRIDVRFFLVGSGHQIEINKY